MNSKLLPIAAALLLAACNQQNAQPVPSSAPSNAPAASTAAPAASDVQAASGAAASTPAAANSKFKSVDVRKDNIGGDFTLTDGSGKPFSLSSLKGKVVLLTFGFTNCPDVCPTELLTFNDTFKQLGEQSKDVAAVFVSVDPDRDTPELIGRYAAQFNPAFIGLTDTNGGRDIAVVKQQYRIVSARTDIKSDRIYNVDHSSGTYIIDKKGEAAVFVPFGADATQIAGDIRKLLAE